MSAIQLREHQVTQRAAFRRWVGFPARASVPAQGARGTIVSATGSGKTITAAACALESFAAGRVLVTVPTLDLLVQTAEAWRAVGHRAPMVAVCSLENDPVLRALGVRTTTNPVQLALWARTGPAVVFATYASLVDREDPEDPTGARKVHGPLEAALAGGERLYGQRMDAFDLVVVDEAHSTAGVLGRPWAAIHDNVRIPADFRLYLTATPRILAAPQPRKGEDGQEVEIATMSDDPEGIYGAWLSGAELGLSEAIEQEILAGFEIDVLEIRDPSPVLGETEEARRGRRLALLQAALLEHAAAHNLRTVMTFHQKVEEARAFADKLPKTAAELYAGDASDEDLAAADKLPKSSIDAEFYELEAGRHVPPNRVWSAWLCGDHLVSERREVLRQFANGITATGHRVHRAFLASCRVLGEGVPVCPVVDALTLAGPQRRAATAPATGGRRALACSRRTKHPRFTAPRGRRSAAPETGWHCPQRPRHRAAEPRHRWLRRYERADRPLLLRACRRARRPRGAGPGASGEWMRCSCLLPRTTDDGDFGEFRGSGVHRGSG
ncbi:DEAD/DEAH box helicase family protein [Streptomyces sp. SID4923]|nr:DEAD/DEAH box helicase family protein [Streptomyces sp. SID4923]